MSASPFDFELSGAAPAGDLVGNGTSLRRNWGVIVVATLLAALAAALFCAVVKPRYTAVARLVVETQENYSPRIDADPREAAQAADAEAMSSQMQLITSRDLARKAVAALHLQGNAEFDPVAGLNPLSAIAAALGLIADPNAQSAEDRLINTFVEHLSIQSPPNTHMLHVAFSSQDPDLAARGANQIADLYIELKTQAKRKTANQTARKLKPLVSLLEARVAEADAKVETYRATRGFDGGESAPMPQSEIAARLDEARTAQSDAQAKALALRELLATSRLDDVKGMAVSDSVRRIADQRDAARAQLALETRTRPATHPRITELEAQLSELEGQLRAGVEKDARIRENDARAAGAKVANLVAAMEEQKRTAGSGAARAGAANSGDIQLRELQREASTLKSQLDSQTARYQAALARDVVDATPSDVHILSRALPPNQPLFPKKQPIVLFAAFAGLILSVCTILARGRGLERGAAGRSATSRPAPPAPLEAVGGQSLPPDAELAGQNYGQAYGQACANYAGNDDNDLERPLGWPQQAAVESNAQTLAKPEEIGSAQRLQQHNPWQPVNDDAPTTAPRRVFAAAPARSLIERIAALAPPTGGVRVVLASALASAPACFALAMARALSREGRAILIHAAKADAHLAVALSRAAGETNLGAAQPGLAQLLTGEASFAESIFRDSQSRLHIVTAGGGAEAAEDDLDLLINALQATYDYVLIAASGDRTGATLGRQASVSLIFAENAGDLTSLHDRFAAAGARHILLASLDGGGEIVEAA